MKIIWKMRYLLLLFFALLSCSKKQYTLERQDLFKIELGLFENQLDFFDREQKRFSEPIDFIVSRGFFYIANTSLGKIMKFSNQGDILSLIYTPRLNIPLSQIWNTGLYGHNFSELERIAIDGRGVLYAVDKTFVEEKMFDTMQSKRIIKVFDSQNRYLYFIGKQGIGGDAFGYIHSMGITSSNELVIISREQEYWFVDIYEESGNSIYSSGALGVEFLSDLIGENLYIDDVSFSKIESILYLSVIDFNKNSSNTTIYSYDFNNGSVSSPLIVNALSDFYPYTMLGADNFGSLYFYAFNFSENYYHIKKYTLGAQHQFVLNEEIRLNLPLDEVIPLFSKLYLDENGLIASLAIHERYAQLSWWRTDQIKQTS